MSLITHCIQIVLIIFVLRNDINGQVTISTEKHQDHFILTEQQNLEWLAHVDTLSINNKTLAIIDRIISDTNIFITPPGDLLKYERNFSLNKIRGCCKPVLAINGETIELHYWETRNSYTKMIDNVIKIIAFLKESKMEDITILTPHKSTELWGDYGRDGAIVISISEKKSKKQLSKFLRAYRSFRN